MQHITYDKNVDEIIDAILTKLNNGAEAKTDLEKMVKRLTNTENIIEYIDIVNETIEYIRSFYV